jgi:hypothetical protein
MKVALATVLFALGSSLAPMQCPSEPNPSLARDETPGEALLTLAKQQREEGDRAGEVRTLQFLVERYALARQAEEARVRLNELGANVPAPVLLAPAGSASASP